MEKGRCCVVFALALRACAAPVAVTRTCLRLTKGTLKPSLLCAKYRPCRPATSQAASRAAEVESLCKAHYDEFVTAVDELRFVQEEGLALRKAVEAQDDSVQAGGAFV